MKWLVPDYFRLFSCKCGKCRNACCKGWKIAVTEKEYFRLIGLDCSEMLHEKIESALVKIELGTSDKFAYIVPDWRGQCRMLGDDGLCMLQKECGEPMIPETCRVYPRSLKQTNGIFKAVLSASCEAVVEILLLKEKIDTCYMEADDGVKPEITESLPPDAETILKESLSIMQDRGQSLNDRIISIGSLLGVKNFKGISLKNILDILGMLLETSDTLKSYAEAAFARYGNGEGDAEKLYDSDFEVFKKNFPKWEIYFENLMVNNLIFASFPYCDKRIDKAESFFGLIVQYEILRLICTVNTLNSPAMEKLTDLIAAVYHLIEHTAFYYNAYISFEKI